MKAQIKQSSGKILEFEIHEISFNRGFCAGFDRGQQIAYERCIEYFKNSYRTSAAQDVERLWEQVRPKGASQEQGK